MTVHRHNPPELHTPRGYSHVVIATGQKIVFIAGQVALDSAGNLVGAGDLGVQARQAFRNLITALSAVDAAPRDIAKLTWYVVNYSEDLLPVITNARREAFGEHAPASTLVGVQALARAGFLIEVEATAILG